MPATPMSVKARLIIMKLVAVRSSLNFTNINSTTMLLAKLITPEKEGHEVLFVLVWVVKVKPTRPDAPTEE